MQDINEICVSTTICLKITFAELYEDLFSDAIHRVC